jgi:hypothetical protein
MSHLIFQRERTQCLSQYPKLEIKTMQTAGCVGTWLFPNTQEAEAGGPEVQGHTRLHTGTLPQKNDNNKQIKHTPRS